MDECSQLQVLPPKSVGRTLRRLPGTGMNRSVHLCRVCQLGGVVEQSVRVIDREVQQPTQKNGNGSMYTISRHCGDVRIVVTSAVGIAAAGAGGIRMDEMPPSSSGLSSARSIASERGAPAEHSKPVASSCGGGA